MREASQMAFSSTTNSRTRDRPALSRMWTYLRTRSILFLRGVFRPIGVAYEFGTVTRASIEAGPRNIWRYRELLPVPTDVAETPNTEPGLTRLVNAARLAESLGVRQL